MKQLDDIQAVIRWVNLHWSKESKGGLYAWDGSSGISVLDSITTSIWIEHKKSRKVIMCVNDFKQAVVQETYEAVVAAKRKLRVHWDLPPLADPKFFEFLDTCIEASLAVMKDEIAS